jgi:hypothetical protein
MDILDKLIQTYAFENLAGAEGMVDIVLNPLQLEDPIEAQLLSERSRGTLEPDHQNL